MKTRTLAHYCRALFRGSWVDVRDISQAHVLSLQKEPAGGNRYIVAAGCATMQDFGE